MSRTFRHIDIYWRRQPLSALTAMGLYRAGYTESAWNNPKNWEYDYRHRWVNGYDNKPHSPLYEDYVKQPGWCRDECCGPQYRRDAKKRNRRYQRRTAKYMLEQEVWE